MSAKLETLATEIMSGNRRALSRAITLVESTKAEHRAEADALLEAIIPRTGRSLRIGITGAPGVGKSSFIEAIGGLIIEDGHKLAVLAVDPTSAQSGGSILGDKTRMQDLAQNDRAFIRPSPSGATLGGVARRSYETMLLCEAAGFDIVLVETVGVGQSETRVADMTDMFLLLLQPGGGDELQGIKRGIMELADLIIVNKADGAQKALAAQTVRDYGSALNLLRQRLADWHTPVTSCSALKGEGLDEVWRLIGDYRAVIAKDELMMQRRREQAAAWMWSQIGEGLLERLRSDQRLAAEIAELETEVRQGRLPASTAANRLLQHFFGMLETEAKDQT